MPDMKISELEGAGNLTGEELLVVVDTDGATKRTKVKRIAKYMELLEPDDDQDEDTEAWGIRAWANFDGLTANVGETVSGAKRRGVKSIVHSATGAYLVTLKEGMGHNTYSPVANCELSGSGEARLGVAICQIVNNSTFRILTRRLTDANAVDAERVNFHLIG